MLEPLVSLVKSFRGTFLYSWRVENRTLAAGNCVVLKPAEQTPTSIMCLMELLQDTLPAGVVNVVTGFGNEAGAALSSSKGIAKVAFTG